MKTKFSLTSKVLLTTILFSSILINPWFSFDSINIPKITVLYVGGSILLFLLTSKQKKYSSKIFNLTLILVILFICWSFLAFILSDMNLVEGLYGVDGRRTGLLTYFFLCIVFLTSVRTANYSFNQKIYVILLFTGLFGSIYSLIQILGLDPFLWNTQYRPIFGFYGNSNFLASMLGISGSTLFSVIASKQFSKFKRISSVIILIIFIFIIFESKSEQGFFVLFSGFIVTSIIWLNCNNNLRKYLKYYLGLVLIGFIAVLTDIFQLSPWRSILYSNSISERGEFWHAGWAMIVNNPLTGLGLDGFRDNYHKYRTLQAAVRDPEAKVSAAHNVFIDIAVGGGVPLLIIYLILIFLVLLSAIKYLNKNRVFDVYYVALFASWCGYTIQTFISINHIGLAIWGWALGGTIVGYGFANNNFENKDSYESSRRGINILLGLIIGSLISFPQLFADVNFRSGLKSGNVKIILDNLDDWPPSIERYNITAAIFLDNGLVDQSRSAIKQGLNFNPNNLQAWLFLYKLPNISESDRDRAISNIKRLDPFNSNIR
jgi:O-antigen ligase